MKKAVFIILCLLISFNVYAVPSEIQTGNNTQANSSLLTDPTPVSNGIGIQYGKRGGQRVNKLGVDYEIVTSPNEVKIYTSADPAQLPNDIYMNAFSDGIPLGQKVHLVLQPLTTSDRDSDTSIYTAVMPADIYVAGGLSFEINF